MTSPHKMFGTNKDLEKETGVKVEYDGFSFTLLRAGGANKKYNTALMAKLKPHRRQIQMGTLDPETNRRLLAEVYAETVIKGWDSKAHPGKMLDQTNTPLDFTKENVVKILMEEEDLFTDLIAFSDDLRNFRDAETEDDAKN